MVRSQHSRAFYQTFQIPLEHFTGSLTPLLGKFDFDVVKFDDWCKTVGYVEDNKTSCADFVKAKWGKAAQNLILKIISGE